MPQATDGLGIKRMLMCKRVAGTWQGTSAQALGYVLREKEKVLMACPTHPQADLGQESQTISTTVNKGQGPDHFS